MNDKIEALAQELNIAMTGGYYIVPTSAGDDWRHHVRMLKLATYITENYIRKDEVDRILMEELITVRDFLGRNLYLTNRINELNNALCSRGKEIVR